MSSLTEYSGQHNTGSLDDECTYAPTFGYTLASLKAVIRGYDDEIFNLTNILKETRCRFKAAKESDRILERQSRNTLLILNGHLQTLRILSANRSDPGFIHFAKCSDSISDDIKAQKIQLKNIRNRIRRTEAEFARFCKTSWEQISSQYLQKDRWMLVLNVQQFELH